MNMFHYISATLCSTSLWLGPFVSFLQQTAEEKASKLPKIRSTHDMKGEKWNEHGGEADRQQLQIRI